MLILIGRGLDLKDLRTSETKGKIEKIGFSRDVKEIWMCGFQGTRRLVARADPIKPSGCLSDRPEIIEKRVDCAEVPQVESFGYK